MNPQLVLFILSQLGLIGGGLALDRYYNRHKNEPSTRVPSLDEYEKWAKEQERQGFVPDQSWRQITPQPYADVNALRRRLTDMPIMRPQLMPMINMPMPSYETDSEQRLYNRYRKGGFGA